MLVAEHPGRKPNHPASVDLDFRPPGNLPADCTIEEWEAAVSVELDDGKVSGPTLDFLSGPIIGPAQADTLTGDRTHNIIADRGCDDIPIGNAGVDTFDYLLSMANGDGPDTITGYTLGATQAASDRIHICRGKGDVPTYSGGDSGSDHVITVVRGSDTTAVITPQGITTGSPNFANLNITVNDNGPSCSSTSSVERRRALRGEPTQGVGRDAESENGGRWCDPSYSQHYGASQFSGTPFLYFSLDVNIEAGRSFLNIIEDGVKMAPGLIAVVLLAGMLFSLPVYAITWGVGMLGEFLRRTDQSETIRELRNREEESRNREAEKDQRLTELEEAQAKSEQDKETLRNQIRRSGQEPEA